MREVTASGKSIDEAINSALNQLNLSKDETKIDIIDEGKKGFLGIFGASRAIVKVTESFESITNAEEYLKNMIQHMNIDAKVDTIVEENNVTFNLSGDKIAILIGKRGKTLNAIQYLVQLVINKHGRNFHSVTVDAEGYRQRREETLMELAQKMASKAVRIDGKVALEPMPAYERKIIHSALQDSTEVSTYSDGVEPHRYIVIKPSK